MAYGVLDACGVRPYCMESYLFLERGSNGREGISSNGRSPRTRSNINMRAAAAWCAAPGSLLRRECGQVPRVYNGGDDSRGRTSGRTYTGLRTAKESVGL